MSKPVVFISYSHKNKRLKERLETHLKAVGVDVDVWSDTRIKAGDDWFGEIRDAMERASLAILVLTTNFLASDFIQNEEMPTLLKRREEEGMIIFPILAKSCAWDEHEWLKKMQIRPSGTKPVWSSRNTDDKLTKIAKEVKALLVVDKENRTRQGKTIDKKNGNVWPTFQNRKEELDRLFDNLTNSGGERFYLLISGPQMGKTWLLNELSLKLQKEDSSNWHILCKNLHDEDEDLQNNSLQLLSSYFSLNFNGNKDELVKEISNIIVRKNSSYLLLLDHAECLNNSVAKELHKLLICVHERLERAGKPNIRFAFVAASRLEIKSWNGVIPTPTFQKFVLTHFKKKVIQYALNEMATIDKHTKLGTNWSRKMAKALDNATEGLPSLLMKYMQYIRDDGYMISFEKIRSPELFEELATPYVKDNLLPGGNSSLFSSEKVEGEQNILEEVLLRLSPYRWISESHIEKVFETEDDLKELLKKKDLRIRDLWNILSQTYLIRPSETVWHEMYPGVRRLLFRYHYREKEEQRKAHEQAYEFFGEWWQEISGTDRILYLVENLWHLVESKRLSEDQQGDKEILDYVQKVFVEALEPNHSTVGDLAKYIIARLEKDAELQYSMVELHGDLFDEILNTIKDIDKKQEDKL